MLGAHALSVLAVALLSLAWWIKLGALLALVASGWWYIRRCALLALPSAITGIELKGDATAALRTADGVWRDARLAPGAFAAPQMTVMKFRLDAARWPRFIVILPDMLAADDYRRLQVWLRWGGVARAAI